MPSKPKEKASKDIVSTDGNLATDKEIRRKEIQELSIQLQSEKEHLERETTKKLAEWNKEVNNFNETVDTIKTQFFHAVSSLTSKTNQIFGWFFKSLDKVTKWLCGITLLAIVVNGTLYALFVGGGVIAWMEAALFTAVILLVFTLVTQKWLSTKVYNDSVELGDTLHSIKESKGVFEGKNQQTNMDLAPLKESAGRLASTSEKIAANIPAYLSSVQDYYEQTDLVRRQKHIAKEMRNALIANAVKVDQKTDDYLNDFHSESGEHQWLNEIADHVSELLGIDDGLVRLVYFDYTQDTSGLKSAWGTLSHDNEALRELAELVLTNELREYADPIGTQEFDVIVTILSRLKRYSIADFRVLYYRLYVELAQMKTSLINVMTFLGFELSDEQRASIKRFVPSTDIQADWKAEVLKHASDLVSKDVMLVSLFYYESMNEDTEDLWRQIRDTPERMNDLISLLLKKEKLGTIPDHYRKDERLLIQQLGDIVGNVEPFSLLGMKQKISETFETLDVDKKVLEKALNSFGFALTADMREPFDSYVPSIGTDRLPNLAKNLAGLILEFQHVEVPEKLILLFYYHHLRRKLEMDDLYNSIKNVLSLRLSTILLQNAIVKMERTWELALEAQNLSYVISAALEFDLVTIQNVYQNYRALAEVAHYLARYMEVEQLSSSANLSFKQVTDVLRAEASNNYVTQVKALCKFLLINYKSLDLKEAEIGPVTIAATCLFLTRERHDVSGRDACHEALSEPLAVKFLYRNMELGGGEAFRVNGKQTFAVAIRQVLDDPSLTFEYLNDFIFGLNAGVVYRDTKDMFGAKSDALQMQLKEMNKLQATADKMRDSVKEFMNAELPEVFLLYALDAQLIQAYMISTKAARGRILTVIVDHKMKEVCERLAESDSSYEDLLLFTEVKTAGGKGTRIGVVPVRMNFDEFARKFNVIFGIAKKEYMRGGNISESEAAKYSANVFRLFASELAFKLIRGDESEVSPEKDPEHPIHVIKELIVQELGFVDAVGLVASSKPDKDRTVLVKKVVTNLFDAKASLYILTRSEIGDILTKHPKLKETMEKKNVFDVELFQKFGCSSFTGFAKAMYSMRTRLGDKGRAISEVNRNLGELIDSHRIRIESSECERLAAVVQGVADNIGEVLQY